MIDGWTGSAIQKLEFARYESRSVAVAAKQVTHEPVSYVAAEKDVSL
jgi:hypothetical protein